MPKHGHTDNRVEGVEHIGTPYSLTAGTTREQIEDILADLNEVSQLSGGGPHTHPDTQITAEAQTGDPESLDEGTVRTQIAELLALINGLPSAPEATVFGTRAQSGYTAAEDTNNTVTPKQTLRITMPSDTPAGTYRIGWAFEWAFSSGSYSFKAQVQVDDATTIATVTQEPQDVATTQRHPASGFGYVTLTAAAHNIDLDFWSAYAGQTARIFDRRLEVWRVA